MSYVRFGRTIQVVIENMQLGTRLSLIVSSYAAGQCNVPSKLVASPVPPRRGTCGL